jgi:hypothetical protein
MTNPIIRSSLFVTPKDFADLDRMIRNIGTPEEQRLVYLGSMMALNLAHKLVEEQEEVLVNSNGELI